MGDWGPPGEHTWSIKDLLRLFKRAPNLSQISCALEPVPLDHPTAWLGFVATLKRHTKVRTINVSTLPYSNPIPPPDLPSQFHDLATKMYNVRLLDMILIPAPQSNIMPASPPDSPSSTATQICITDTFGLSTDPETEGTDMQDLLHDTIMWENQLRTRPKYLYRRALPEVGDGWVAESVRLGDVVVERGTEVLHDRETGIWEVNER
ncbi:Protein transport protein SEC61 subunit alpha [Elsinoe australis]|uniref:Protein transport protein SEC61 subunit alpha n=1 Tax=Elsinoe australis TaxID=40998 RepID=A0A2P7ZE92_9PEZI|nr:Protein transport protein SEC61 subunit alpha [Elsinoe australis]